MLWYPKEFASFINYLTVTSGERVFVEFNMIDNAKIKGELPSSAEISQLDGSSPVFRLVDCLKNSSNVVSGRHFVGVPYGFGRWVA